jgi:uncharacterized protein (TIGR04255 family)
MPLMLPAPDTDRLPRSPLSQVVCQIRHERLASVADARQVLAIHERVRSDYPNLVENAAQEFVFSAGPTGLQPMVGQPERGWRLRAADDSWAVALMPDFFAIETSRYEDWPDFRRRIDELTRAVEETLHPSIEKRLGLRYVDQILDGRVKAPTDWAGIIDDRLLGPILHGHLGSGVTAAQQVLQLDGGDGALVLLRHGFVHDVAAGSFAYVLDHDCFQEKGREFQSTSILEAAEKLHTIALQVFQAALTPEYFESMKQEQV